MRRRGLLLLGGAAAASLGAALLLRPEGESIGVVTPGALAFPGLAQHLGDAARVELRRGGQATTLVRRDDAWGIAEMHGYPARPQRLRETLTALTELRLMEERTSDPAQFARLGLDEAAAATLRVLNAQGGIIAEAILGSRRVRTQGPSPESIHFRRPGENRTWLAEGRLVADADPGLWVDRDLTALAPDRLRRVEITRAGEPPLVLARAGEVDAPLDIITPTDPPIADRLALDEVGRGFDMLSFIDVRPAAVTTGEALGEARFAYTDDVTITLWARREEQVLWVVLRAEGGEEAQRLQARFGGWAYQLGLWKEKALIPRIEDLLVP